MPLHRTVIEIVMLTDGPADFDSIPELGRLVESGRTVSSFDTLSSRPLNRLQTLAAIARMAAPDEPDLDVFYDHVEIVDSLANGFNVVSADGKRTVADLSDRVAFGS